MFILTLSIFYFFDLNYIMYLIFIDFNQLINHYYMYNLNIFIMCKLLTNLLHYLILVFQNINRKVYILK